MKRIMAGILVASMLAGCSQVPITGRRQLRLVSNEELYATSFQSYDQFLKEAQVITGTPEAQMVKNVGVRIQRAAEQYMRENNAGNALDGFKWEFNLVKDDKTINAWCMPGGKVAVYTGILPVTKTETGLAVVMGHEIAHAIAEHSNERSSQTLLANGLLQGSSILVGQNPTMVQQILLQAAGAGSQLGLLKFSRSQESEADEIGLIFMAMAGYDPNESVAFWQRMSQATSAAGAAPPEFLSTHPSDDTRIRDLQKLIPKAMEYYKKSN